MCIYVCVRDRKDRQRGTVLTYIECREGHDNLGRDGSKIHRPNLQACVHARNTHSNVARDGFVIPFASVMIALS